MVESLLDLLCTDLQLIVYRFIHDDSYRLVKGQYFTEVIWSDEVNACLSLTMDNRRCVAQWRPLVPGDDDDWEDEYFIWNLWGKLKCRTYNTGEEVRVSHNHFSQRLYR